MNESSKLTQFILRSILITRSDPRSERGYAMLIVSMLLIILLSLAAAYVTFASLATKRTDAFVDGNSAFTVAESGLNTRAQDLRQRFLDFGIPKGTVPGITTQSLPQRMSSCFSVAIPAGSRKSVQNIDNDFECRNYGFRNNNNLGGGGLVLSQRDNSSASSNFIGYTFVSPAQDYTITPPSAMLIGAGETYAGLMAQQYKYSVFSTAKKPVQNQSANYTAEEISAKSREAAGTKIDGDPALIASYNAKQTQATTNAAENSTVNTILETTFKNYAIPLFQFAAFYKRDLEINSTSNMIVNGWTHTNGNLYIQPTPQQPTDPGIDFLGKVTASGEIYNRVDASTIQRNGTARVQLSTASYYTMPAYSSSRVSPFTQAELSSSSGKVIDGVGGAVTLNPPDATFLRKRNYYDNSIGDYFGKADIRLEAVPDRLLPFNLIAIQSGANATGGACSTSPPAAGSDPAANYIDPTRQGASFKCTQLNKGQLLSVSQPVLVLTKGHAEEETRFCGLTAGIVDRTRNLIDYANVTANPTVLALSIAKQDIVLRALQTVIVGHNIPLNYSVVIKDGILPVSLQTAFRELLTSNSLNLNLSSDQIKSIATASPASIAKARKSCFLPAPIGRVVKSQAGVISDGVFDRRENRSISTIQTNIESLTVWNRDGRYVSIGGNLNTDTASTSSDRLNSATNTTTYSTNNLLFIKAAATGSVVGSFEKLGLSGGDRTEGGLIFHAIVNDDLNGDGSIDSAKDVVGDSTAKIYKQNADGSNILDSTGNSITIDYSRRYKGGAIRQSPYGFAFSGGNNLPAPLSVVSDQAIYLQGDWNNYPSAWQSSAILGDTIATLSNNCLSPGASDPGGVLTGQINCLIPTTLPGTAQRPWTRGNVQSGTGFMYRANPTTVKAAFLSLTDRSNGNLGTGRGFGTTPQIYSGGLNNYMRMVEDWSGQAFNYTGSFVSLGYPIEFSGAYQAGGLVNSYYGIPIRNFSYETNFNSFEKLPPLTPRVIYLQQEVFKRSY